MQKLKSRNWLRSLQEAGGRVGIPQFATFELSYACNLRCLHCFNPTHAASSRELAAPEIFRILSEIAGLGVLDVCFTGGEPLLHPEFFAILEKAKTLGLTVSMNTNASRLTPGFAARLDRIGLSSLSASLYGATARVYEAVTGVPGSHARFLAGLEALAQTRISVTLQMPVMTLNRDEVLAAKELARLHGFGFLPSVDIYPGQAGDPAPLRRRLSPDEKFAVLRELGLLSSGAGKNCPAGDASFFDCDCGKTQFAITPYGEMNLCTIFPFPKYDLRGGAVRDGWEVLKRTVAEARPNENYECPSCELKSHCRQGRADSWLEKKDMSACLPHYKDLARLEKNRA